MNYSRSTITAVFALFLFAQGVLATEQFEKRSGEYTVYYSLFPSSFLLPDIAEKVGITRGRNHTVLNVSVRRADTENTNREQSALVKGTSSDLVHNKPLEFIEVREQGAIYYLAEIETSNPARLYFDLQVSPNPNKPPIEIKFNREVYPE